MSAKKDAIRFAAVGLILQVIFFVLFAIFFSYPTGKLDEQIQNSYAMFQDVHVMIFIGFGFLMTFLSKHGFGSVGFNFMVAAYALQWALLAQGIIRKYYEESKTDVTLTMESLILADFRVASVLIAFGAVVGRVSPLQLLMLAMILVPIQVINEYICDFEFGAFDAGGAMFVHTFGAYFGLAASWALSRGKYSRYSGHPLNSATRTSDTFAMIGTLFLWVFWPSFTSAVLEGEDKHRSIVNTLLSLSSCASVAFGLSVIMRPDRKFSMVDVQNATLAGGVAVGTVCNMDIHPWGAVLVGCVAAFVSVAGYVFLQPVLETNFGLFDTCGVHNLHGMPGVLGGIGGILAAGLVDYEVEEHETRGQQAGYQALALVVTIAMALFGGVLSGFVLRMKVFSPIKNGRDYEDKHFWHVEGEDDTPPVAVIDNTVQVSV